MRHLDFPIDANDDFILRQCRRPDWAAYRDRWLDAAAEYRQHGGDPWEIAAADFTEAEQDRLYELYDNRRSSEAIRRIRRPEGLLSCPVCGSGGGRSLDHWLPRSTFPEFSILRENLIPACTNCNSEEKGDEFRGDAPPERFIHPYYDDWASMPLWRVRFDGDLDAITFSAEVLPEVPVEHHEIVFFHLSQVLGREWQESNRRFWGSLPQLVRNRVVGAITGGKVAAEIQARLTDQIIETGNNGWWPAFLRGVLAQGPVVPHLCGRILALPG